MSCMRPLGHAASIRAEMAGSPLRWFRVGALDRSVPYGDYRDDTGGTIVLLGPYGPVRVTVPLTRC